MKILTIFSSRRGSAVLIGLIVLMLLTIVTTVFLERIWNFSKSSNGIEASNRAYYYAIGAIEQQLMDPNVNKYHPWQIAETGSTISMTYGVGGKLSAFTGDYIVPSIGKGNSPFDQDYNIISLGEPIQLVIPDQVNWNNVNFYFRIPEIGSGSTGANLACCANSGAILWTLGYTGASLFASGELSIFTFSDLDNTAKKINGKDGISNSGSSLTFGSFYNDTTGNFLDSNGAKCANHSCTLKLSMIRPVQTDDSTPRALSFLEYRIDFTPAVSSPLPNQYMLIQSDAYAYGFMRSRTIRIPQITTNTALDFAVLQ